MTPANSSLWVVAPLEGALAVTRFGFNAIFFFLSPISSATFAASMTFFAMTL